MWVRDFVYIRAFVEFGVFWGEEEEGEGSSSEGLEFSMGLKFGRGGGGVVGGRGGEEVVV